MLHPTFISLDTDGGTKIETCSNRIGFIEREHPVGQFLEDGFVICGGSFAWSFKVLDDCIVVKRFETQTFKMIESEREWASSVKLNDTTMWITGGYDTSSTELVTVNGTTRGIDLPFTIERHCTVMIGPSTAFLIGGKQNGTWTSDKTWIVDIDNDFQVAEGPLLNNGREDHWCGAMKDESGDIVIAVVGGQSEHSVEFLNTNVMDKWIYGKLFHNYK